MGMKFRVVCRKLYDYVRYDLKEIAFPSSSLLDPPHIKKRPKLTWKDKWCILKEATRLYGASWVRYIGPDLRPNDWKVKEDINNEEGRSEPTTVEDLLGCRKLYGYVRYVLKEIAYKKAKEVPGINTVEGRSEPTMTEDVLGALKVGAEKAKACITARLDIARASNYTDALKNYVESYKEELKEHLEEEKPPQSPSS